MEKFTPPEPGSAPRAGQVAFCLGATHPGNPSAQVLDALSRALRLDGDARDHLYRLGGTVPDGPAARLPDQVSPGLRQLMDGCLHTPAFVLDRTLDILATNALADALYSPFHPADNLARMAFADRT